MNDPPEEHPKTQAERRLLGLSRLLETTHFLAAHVELAEILPTIARQACRGLDCERATLYQYDPDTEELFANISTELEIAPFRRSIESGITGFVAKSGAMLNVPDPHIDPRWDPSVDRRTGFHTRNILAVPLKSPHDGQLLGVLELFNNHGGPFDKDDEEFAQAFALHAAAALDRAKLVAEIERRKELEAALQVAREVQRRFMPQKLPKIPGYEAASWWFPNQHVGGDYCDIWQMQDGVLGFCVADVCGHGLGPSLLMATVRAALRTLLLSHDTPSSLLGMLGRALSDDLAHGAFVTMILGMLDPNSHQLRFANAGHGPAFIYRESEQKILTLEATGVPLGVLEGAVYELGPEHCLLPRDLVVFCTDGIVEAHDASDVQFGLERLEKLVAASAHLPIQAIADRIGAAVTEHYVGDYPPDDLTVLIVRRV